MSKCDQYSPGPTVLGRGQRESQLCSEVVRGLHRASGAALTRTCMKKGTWSVLQREQDGLSSGECWSSVWMIAAGARCREGRRAEEF